jgi:hypothetical protein
MLKSINVYFNTNICTNKWRNIFTLVICAYVGIIIINVKCYTDIFLEELTKIMKYSVGIVDDAAEFRNVYLPAVSGRC